MTYDDFLHSKVQVAPVSGFEVEMERPSLFDLMEQEAEA